MAIPKANKKEKVRKRKGEKKRLLEENLKVEYVEDEEEESRFKICFNYEEEKSDRLDNDENVPTSSLLKIPR